ncbi:uncharacterized protein LOC110441374 isoform X2 [Mizuhopecten yessoensis]|uniref:uncharacterized protein LOC110441374 isoform X2 n=1 Tax=Mizuhopecten yessoensis TaxID=6573 RepID=UPI000B45F46A|nr:uncharacterized protein LOC110441374 isoform X2 [Mizuhopecten yessoensis]
MGWCFIFHLIYGISKVIDVSGGGTGLVRLLDYSSTTVQDTTGATVDVCVGPTVQKVDSQCLCGRTTVKLDQQSDFIFFRFKSATNGLVVSVGELDYDRDTSGDNEELSDLTFSMGPPDSKSSVRTETASRERTNISIAYILACDEYYYGDCSTYCRPKYPMYGCDRGGQRTCLTGHNCETPVHGAWTPDVIMIAP